MVLSVAPTADDVPAGLTLEQYLAQDHLLGPVEPSAAIPSDAANEIDPATTIDPQSPAATDQVLVHFDMGEGEGDGDGGDGGDGSGGGGEEPGGSPPVISVPETEGGVISGSITDDGDLGDLTPILSGPGTLTMDENGGFTIDLTGVEDHGTGTLTITDGDGNSTTIVYSY